MRWLTVSVLAGVMAPCPVTATSVSYQLINALYPETAYEACTEGWVFLEFIVRADGSAEKIHVLASEPAGVFDAAAVKAISRWQFGKEASSREHTAGRRTIKVEFSIDRC